MPESQFVAAGRLRPLIVYSAVAFIALLGGATLVDLLGSSGGLRQTLVICWMVLFPVGAWLTWKRTGEVE